MSTLLCFSSLRELLNSDDITNGITVLVLGQDIPFDGKAGFYSIVSISNTDFIRRDDVINTKHNDLKAVPVIFENEMDLSNKIIGLELLTNKIIK